MPLSKSILILGGSGFLGTQLALTLREGFKVFATYCSNPINIPGVTCLPYHLENRNWTKRIIYTVRPDVVIYAIGNNSREWADRNIRQTEQLHSIGPAAVAGITEIMQPRFIYISNPYVFDGVRGNYHENETVLPATILGKMKLSGENIIKSKSLNYIILRSSPLFGRGNGLNFSMMDHFRMQLDRNQRFEASPYEIHSFAPIEGFCDLITRLIDSGIRNRVIHYGGLTKLSYFQFSKRVAEHFKYDSRLILPKGIMLKKAGFTEDHVYDFSLNSSQAVETLKIKPFLLEEGLDLIEKKLITHL